jgi:hypothetical protein
MSVYHCCTVTTGGPSHKARASSAGDQDGDRPKLARRGLKYVRWLVPSVILVLLPKCPMCLAAYVALGTGVGLSFSTATYLREMLVLLCVGALLYLAAKSVRTFARRPARFARIERNVRG